MHAVPKRSRAAACCQHGYAGCLPLAACAQLPLGRLLALGALLRSPRFMAAVDAAQKRALRYGGLCPSYSFERTAELAMQYRRVASRRALRPVACRAVPHC